MREIKFRGKRVDNGEWVYGGYYKHIKRQVSPIGDSLKESDIEHLIIQSGFADWNMPRPLQAVEVIPDTAGQFTGLKDKNGVEIYEGDILRNVDNPFVDKLPFKIEWNELYGACFWWSLLGEVGTDHLYQHIAKDCEVIGNIYENKELLQN